MTAAIDLYLFQTIPGKNVLLLPDTPQFTIVAASDDHLQLTKRSRAELVGKGLFEAFPSAPYDTDKNDEQAVRASFDHVLEKKEPHLLPLRRYDIMGANGKYEERYWSTITRPVINDAGEVVYLIHTTEDVSSSVRLLQAQKDLSAAKQVEESEARFRSLLKVAPIGISIFKGRELVIEMANKTMIRLWGKGDGVIGERFARVLPEIESQRLLSVLDQVYTTGQRFETTETPVDVMHGGTLKRGYYDFSFTPLFDAEGKVYAILNLATEVTERVQAHLALEESETNLRNMILQAPVAMLILEGENMIVKTINDRMLEMIGKTSEILHKPLLEVIPELDGQEGYESCLRVYKEGEPVYGAEILVSLIRNEVPEDRYFNFAYTPIRRNGKIVGVMDVAMEVTDQVLARRKVEASEADLQKRVLERTADLNHQKAFISSILDASLNGIYAVKAVRDTERVITDFTYLFANNNIAQLLNRSVEEIIGCSMLALLPENRFNGFFDLFCTLLKTGKTHRDETHFVAQNIDRWFYYVIVPLDEDTLVVSIEDITEKKRSGIQMEEQRNLLDSILKNSSNGISVGRFVRNEDGKLIDAYTILANEAAVNFSGFPRDVYLSKKATEIEPDILSSPYFDACIKTLETGEPFVTQYHTQSTERWLEVTVSRLDQDHLIHVFTDVTPIKEVQLQLERYVEDLKRSNQNLEQFAYAASHDLKEPMRKVQIFSDRLKDRLLTKLEEEDKHYFNRIMQATHRMNTLIDDLLLYSHVSSGVGQVERVDLNKKLQLVLEDLEVEIAQTNATVTAEPLPVINGQRRQLQQLFQNLIGNAIKYAKPGLPPQVYIRCRVISGSEPGVPVQIENKHKAYYLIEVSDNGIGFDPEDAQRIFNVFTRLHGNAEYKGTGVGLSIVQKVVENHHGYIWAEGKAGEGSTFKMLLPIEP